MKFRISGRFAIFTAFIIVASSILAFSGCGTIAATPPASLSTSLFTTVKSVTAILEGTAPMGSLTTDNVKIYGRTYTGGQFNKGISFSIYPDGSGYTVLHNFGGPGDTAGPRHDSMIFIGNTLCGGTLGDGVADLGGIFTHNTDGGAYTILHQFMGGANDGSTPHSCPRLNSADNCLYGLTQLGGSHNEGTLFKINRDGSNFTILHSFLSSTDGAQSHSSVAEVVGTTALKASEQFTMLIPSVIIMAGVIAISLFSKATAS